MAVPLRRRALLAGALGVPLAACRPGTLERVALPTLEGPLELRTAYFKNPRIAPCPPDVQASICTYAAALARQHWAADHVHQAAAARDRLGVRRLAGAAAASPGVDGLRLQAWRWRPVAPGGRYARNLERSASALPQLLEYAGPHLLQPPASASHAALAEALVDTQLARLADWRALRGQDGSPLLDDNPYNEYNAWLAAAAHGQWPYEMVLTNQLLASAEYDNNHLHSALRGGVSNGLCTVSPRSRNGLVAVLSLHPFFSNDGVTLALRGGVAAQGDEPVRWAAALLVHELGHQLLHLDHPFGRSACIMNPPPLLHFRPWLAGLDAGACRIGSSPEMKPGAVRFERARL